MARLARSAFVCAAILAACTPTHRESAEQAARELDARWIDDPLQRLTSAEMEGRDNRSPGGERARRYLIEQLAAIGLAPRGPSGWEQPFMQGVNLLAELRGRHPFLAEEYVLLGAHYDHLGRCGAQRDAICPGAVDNAAGVAAVLGIARALAGSAAGTRRSILVALWDAEEDGLLGSRLYVGEQPVVPLERIVAVVNLDTLGGTIIRGVQASFALGSEYADEALRALIHGTNEPAGYEMYPVSSFFDGSLEQDGGRSDHVPFRDSEIPSVWYSSGAPPEYHTPADTPAIVDQAKLLGTARHALLVTAELANTDALPSFAPRRPHLDDARALIAMGEIVLADPAAAGFDSPPVIRVLESWLERLRAYVASPPASDEEWAEYDRFIRSILRTVFAMAGGR